MARPRRERVARIRLDAVANAVDGLIVLQKQHLGMGASMFKCGFSNIWG
jgi:hypothetical protein